MKYEPQSFDDSSNSFQDDKLKRFERTLKAIQPRSANLDYSAILAVNKRSRPRVSVTSFMFASCCGGSALAGVLLGFVLFGVDERQIQDFERKVSQQEPLIPSPSPLKKGEGSEHLLGSSPQTIAERSESLVDKQHEASNLTKANVPSDRTPRRLTAGYLISKSNIELLMDDLSMNQVSMTDTSSENLRSSVEILNDSDKYKTFYQLRKEAQL